MYTKSVRECYARVRVRIAHAVRIYLSDDFRQEAENVYFLISVKKFSIPQTRITHQTVFNRDRFEVALPKLA